MIGNTKTYVSLSNVCCFPVCNEKIPGLKCPLLPGMQPKDNQAQIQPLLKAYPKSYQSNQILGESMTNHHFYFISDEYFQKFHDRYLMQNKESTKERSHNRPCYCAFQDRQHPELYWFIPFSSQVSKFRKVYKSKLARYQRCNTIVFGQVLGHEKAFLIQNMCPVTRRYITMEYMDSASQNPVQISHKTQRQLLKYAREVIEQLRRGNTSLIFPDVLSIEKQLLKEVQQEVQKKRTSFTTNHKRSSLPVSKKPVL